MNIDVQALYDALAKVLERRDNVKVKFTVERELKDEKDSRD